MPVSGGATRAVMRKTSASALEQNHFSPVIFQVLPGPRPPSRGSARTALAPTSEPPWTSVRNCEAVKFVLKSGSRRGRR